MAPRLNFKAAKQIGEEARRYDSPSLEARDRPWYLCLVGGVGGQDECVYKLYTGIGGSVGEFGEKAEGSLQGGCEGCGAGGDVAEMMRRRKEEFGREEDVQNRSVLGESGRV